MPWADQAACQNADPEAFFVETGDSVTTEKAKNICRRCPVVDDCLEYALKERITFGVWGATTANDRRLLMGHVVKGVRRFKVAANGDPT